MTGSSLTAWYLASASGMANSLPTVSRIGLAGIAAPAQTVSKSGDSTHRATA